MEKSKRVEITADREIAATRLLDAPRELVWKMFTDPQHIAQWWGPNGFTNTIHQMDVRPGGVWDFIMHGPDGTNYKNKNVFVEVVAPEKISYDHVSAPIHHVDITLEAVGNQTKLSFCLTFETAEERNACAEKFGAVEGLSQTLGRLKEKVEADAAKAPTEPFVISRTFDAPRALVWKAWTERDRLMQWFGPKGFTMTAANLDLRPGGVFHYALRSPEGREMWGKFVYREIVEPERIVLITSFSDKDGNLTRHPMSPTWPLEMFCTTTLKEQGGKTTLTIEWIPWNATETEIQTFAAARPNMSQGWGGTLEQLEAYLASHK